MNLPEPEFRVVDPLRGSKSQNGFDLGTDVSALPFWAKTLGIENGGHTLYKPVIIAAGRHLSFWRLSTVYPAMVHTWSGFGLGLVADSQITSLLGSEKTSGN
jgi:hypothetical protein